MIGPLAILSGLALAWAASAGADVVVDDFSTTQSLIADPPGGASHRTTAGTDILGRERSLSVLRVAGSGPVDVEVAASALTFRVADTTPESRGEVLVSWDGNIDPDTLDPTGLLAVDLTAGGTGGLAIEIEEATAGVSLVVTIYEDANRVSRVGRVLPQVLAPTTLFLDWSELVAAPGAVDRADLGRVGAVTLVLTARGAAQVSLGRIAAVAPQAAAVKIDLDANGAPLPPGGVEPGDTLRYRVTLESTGVGTTGARFEDTLDTNLALVPGSVRTTPLARRDHYATVTDVELDSAAELLPALLDNDLDLDGDALAVVAVSGQATAQGGSVDIDAAGDFVYTPPVGFQGVDTFAYTLEATAGDPTRDADDEPLDPPAGRAYVIVDRVAPVLDGAGTVVFTEDAGPVAVAPALTVADADSPNLASARVTIQNLLDFGFETLAADTTGTSIVAAYMEPTLTLTGSDTLASYQQVLRSVTYANTSNAPDETDRQVEIVVSDGLLSSAPETATVEVVSVNDPPTLNATGGTSDFVEDGGPVVVDGGLAVLDVDDTDLESASVAITATPDGASEGLAVSACGGLTVGGAGTASLTITGTASVAAYQVCLRSVTYANASQNPNAAARTVTFTVHDGTDSSNVVGKTVTVTPVNDAPVFGDDTLAYTTVGNTQLRAGDITPGASVVHLRDNDDAAEKGMPTDVDGPGPFVYSLASAPANGQATVNADGTFTYEPNPGFHGPTDTFTVQVSDQALPTPGVDTATVTVAISHMVWYVHDVVGAANPAAGDDGRSTNAFEALADVEPFLTDDDTVFVFRGNTGTTAQVGSFDIDHSGVKLHGEGVGLTLPGFGTLVPAGLRPRIANPGAAGAPEDNGVNVIATASSVTGVEIRGFEISGRDNAVDVTATGTHSVGVRISESSLTSDPTNGLEGVDINAGSTGTVTLAIHDNTFTARGTALDITRTAGTVRITAFDDNIVSGATQGSGIFVAGPNVVFDADPATAALDAVSGGTTAIGQLGDSVGSASTHAGLHLADVTGDLRFTDLDVYSAGYALFVQGTGAFTGATGTRFEVTPAAPDDAGSSVLVGTGGGAVDARSATIDLRLAQLTSTPSTLSTAGVHLQSIGGQFRAPAGSSIVKSAGGGTAFVVAGSVTGTSVAYAGSLDVTAGAGVSLTNNSGSTIAFSGGMALATGTNAGFSATGGGTVTVTDPVGPANNTITTTTGTPLTVSNTGIGSAGLTFERISANGAASGIVLSSTLSAGTDGGLRVTGTGSAGSGGTIQNTTGDGVSLSTTANVSLASMQLTNTGRHGVSGAGLVDETGGATPSLSVTGSRLTSPGDADNESAFSFGTPAAPGDNTGRIVIADTVVEQFEENGVQAANSTGSLVIDVTGTLSGLADSTTKFDDNNDTHGQHAVIVVSQGTAAMTLNVSGVYMNNIEAEAILAQSTASTSTLDVNLVGNVSINGGGPDNFPSGGGFAIVQDAGGSATFDIQGNVVRDLQGDGIVIIADGPSSGRIGGPGASQGNVVSGSLVGDGIRIDTDQLPGGGNHFTATILIQNNQLGTDGTFPGLGDDGIQILHRDGTKTLDLTIEGNQVANTASEAIRYFTDADVSDAPLQPRGSTRVAGNTFTNIGVSDATYFQTQDTAQLCLHLSGNTYVGANRNISLNQQNTSQLQITQASVAAVAVANPGSTASSTGTITTGGTCTNPPLPIHP